MSHAPNDRPALAQRPQLILAWTAVAVPLLYGLANTIKNTLPLFGG
ncbi:MFS transporter small subunit [Demetria terragena]|nr:hypothetical protein [Demetria terragena]